VVAPRVKSGLELAQKPTLTEVQQEGLYLKFTDILDVETSPAATDHSARAVVLTENDCRAE